MAKNKKYDVLADEILHLVGGKENIKFLTHCMTRLRFNVKDKGLVKIDEIDQLAGVVGSRWAGDQLQIIIGQTVEDVYSLICEKAGLEKESAIDVEESKKSKFSLNTLFDAISGCITPVIPVLVGAGMIKVVVLLGELTGLLATGSNTHNILSFVGDAGFYFLPIMVGASSAKKFGANQYLGMLMGGILVYPELVNLMGQGASLSVFGLPIFATYYPYSIFTSILIVFVMSYIEKFIAKHSHEAIRSITEPLFTILIMIPLSLCLLAPLGAIVGTYFTDGILWLYQTTGFLSVALLAAVIPFVVMTGMHSAFDPYLIQAYAKSGSEPIGSVVFFINNFNQGAASAAVAVCTKDVKLKAIAASGAITAIVGGVCEPAMYGVNLRLKKPMYASMIGSAVAGAYVGLTHVLSYAYPGNAALFGMLTFVGPDKMNLVNFIIGMVLGIIVTFVATIVLVKRDKEFK